MDAHLLLGVEQMVESTKQIARLSTDYLPSSIDPVKIPRWQNGAAELFWGHCCFCLFGNVLFCLAVHFSCYLHESTEWPYHRQPRYKLCDGCETSSNGACHCHASPTDSFPTSACGESCLLLLKSPWLMAEQQNGFGQIN